MDTIQIVDLEVHYRVGVPDHERAQAQRLLLSLELLHPFAPAAAADDLRLTIDYFAVCQRLLHFGDGREWKLIETLAQEIAESILREFQPRAVTIEIKKFIIPQTRYVAVRITRPAPAN